MAPVQRTVVADRGDAGRRLDHVVCRHLAGLSSASRTRVQRWITAGHVTVNAQPVVRAAARVAAGDQIGVMLTDGALRTRALPQDLALDVLYEDDHLLAIDKPAGVVVHPTYGHRDGTILNALLWRARGWADSERPSIVGRLDKLTSGIVVAARTARVHTALQRAFASKETVKEYLALVYGRVRPASGRIDVGLGRDPGDRRRVIASATGGLESVTRFARLDVAATAGLSLLKCELETGRMHQIRVHLAARGWPIVGDPKYGEPRWTRVADPALRACLAAFPRQALHASRLSIVHPVTRQPLTIEAPLPADLRDLLAAARLVQCVE